MIVLSRKKNESIVINDDITIVVVEIRGDKVRLGVEAPKEVPVHRREVFDAIYRNGLPSSQYEPSFSAPPPPPPRPPVVGPAEITLSGRNVSFVDRVREAIGKQSGWAPCRAQTVEAILDGLRESEKSLSEASSLAELTALLTRTPQKDGEPSHNGHSRSLPITEPPIVEPVSRTAELV